MFQVMVCYMYASFVCKAYHTHHVLAMLMSSRFMDTSIYGPTAQDKKEARGTLAHPAKGFALCPLF